MASAAAAKPAAPPGAFTFLKQGAVLSARRPGLFLRVFALNVVLAASVLLFKALAVAPRFEVLNCGEILVRSGGGGVPAGFARDAAAALLAAAAFVALYLAAWTLVRVATACAAVAAASSSGERRPDDHRTLASLIRGRYAGAAATWALGCALRAASVAAVVLLALPLPFLWDSSRWLLLALDATAALVALTFGFYLKAVCAMAVVVSVAEAEDGRRRLGCRGAVARAWRLMRGARASAWLAATWALARAVGPACALAVWWMRESEAAAVVAGFGLWYVLHRAVRMVSDTALAAYYFECRKREEDHNKAAHAHAD